jgi:hypothetical protein
VTERIKQITEDARAAGDDAKVEVSSARDRLMALLVPELYPAPTDEIERQ